MNVLLSSIGRRSYLAHYFKSALDGRGYVIGTNCIPDTPGMIAADVRVVVPQADQDSFVLAMLDICRRHRPRLLFSLHDLEAPVIAEHSVRFAELGTQVVLGSKQFCMLCLDKLATADFAAENRLGPCPTYTSVSEAEAAISCGQLQFPLILKPRYGFGSFSIHVAWDSEELQSRFRLLKAEISRNRLLRTMTPSDDLGIVIQQNLQGTEYGLDVLNSLEGEFVTCLIERKLGIRAGETDAAEIVEDDRLFALGRRLANATKHPGVIDVDVIVQDGHPFLLEMNPRFGGHYPFAHVAGANIPAALIAWAEGREADPRWLQAKPGHRAFKDFALIDLPSLM